MQEAFLRRDRNGEIGAGDDDRLSELSVPGAEGDLLPLERREVEVLAADQRVDRGEVGGARPRGSLADGADRDPGLIVHRPHETIGEALKPVLHLRGAPLLVRRVPAHGHETGGAGDRPRVPGAEGKVRTEHFLLVGDHQHVIGRRALREDRHLLLDLLLAGIRAARARRLLVFSLFNDRAAEALRRPANGLEISEVLGEDALHHEPALPFLPHEILRERIGEHVAVWRRVQDVGAAFFLPQLLVFGAHVEQEHVPSLDRVGKRKKRLRRRIDEDEVMSAVDKLLQGGDRVASYGHALDVEGKFLLGETAGGVVVLERHFRAGNAVVLRLDMQPRQRDRPLHLLLEIADRHFGHLGR